jgi:hypothetical protein
MAYYAVQAAELKGTMDNIENAISDDDNQLAADKQLVAYSTLALVSHQMMSLNEEIRSH